MQPSTRVVTSALSVFLLAVAPTPLATAQSMGTTDTLRSLAMAEREAILLQHRRSLLPQPIAEAEFDAFISSLELNEAKRASLSTVFESYESRFNDSYDQQRRRIEDRFAASYRYDETTRTVRPEPSPVLIELLEDHVSLLERTLNAENQLIEQVAAMLAPAQTASLRRFELERVRSYMPIISRDALSSIDLDLLLQEMNLTEAERSQLQPILTAQRGSFADELRERLVDERRHIDLPRARYLVAIGPYWRMQVANEEELNAIRAELASFDRRGSDLVMLDRMHRLTLIQRITSVLPPERARTFRQSLFGSLWPWFDEDRERIIAASQRLQRELAGAGHHTVAMNVEQSRERLMENLDRSIRRSLQTLLDDDEPLHAIVERSAADHNGVVEPGAVPLKAEEAWLELRTDRRATLINHLVSILGLAGGRDLEAVDPIDRLRDTMRAQQEADSYRLDALRDVIRAQR